MNEETTRSAVEHIARADFETAYRKGFWRSIVSWLTQAKNELMPFDEVRKNLPWRGEHFIGLKQVELDSVVGSVGRYRDFDRAFLPRQKRTEHRWVSIDSAHLQDVTLPPIDLYKVGSAYFVKDGNHRVSVARERGQVFIDANVIEIDLPVEITPDMDINEIIAQREQIEFMEATHLAELQPGARIRLTVPGGYQKLLEHISAHRYFMGINQQREIPWEEAVTNWFEQVYMPMVRIADENEILKEFPGRTQGDLYLWIMEHLWYLREKYQSEVSLEAAAAHFAEEFSERPLAGLFRFLRGLMPEREENGDRESEE
jgi:hypothetical protein